MSDKKPASCPEIYSLTGIRAIAALWVVLYHLRGFIAEQHPAFWRVAEPFLANGFLGVDLFFVLSGFIIYYNYSDRMRPLRLSGYLEFLWLRLARLWPVHFAMMILFALAIGYAYYKNQPPRTPEFYTASTFIQNFFMVHNWAIPANASWNVPAWSISCEWLAYLLFPLVILFRLPHASTRSALLVAVTAFFAEGALCQWLGVEGNNRFGVIRILGAFTAGAALCRLYSLNAGRNLPWGILIPAASLALVAVSFWLLPALQWNVFWCVSLLGFVVLGCAYQTGGIARFLSTKPMLFGGYISYSLYMVHEFTGVVLVRFNTHSIVIHLGVMLVAAILLYYVIEEPFRKMMRRWYSRRIKRPTSNIQHPTPNGG